MVRFSKVRMKIFGFTGWSGSGKTTLIEQLIPRFVLEGLTVSLIKHAHHGFDIDKPGKDSYRHREAGCTEVLLTSDERWVLMHELRGRPEPILAQQIELLSPCDLVLVEGFKAAPIPKLEVYRPAHGGRSLMYPENPNIVAVASDVNISVSLPLLDLNDPDGIADFILDYLSIKPSETSTT